MSDLIEHAKAKSRESCEELTGPDDDIMPIMLFKGPQGFGFMPLGSVMEDDDTKEEGALWMMATLAVSRAVEAVMITTAYMIDRPMDDPDVDIEHSTLKGGPVRDQPDRTENIVLMCSDNERAGMVSAPLTRYPDKPPTLGDWMEWPQPEEMGGRFGNAISVGLRMAREMPPEMVEIVEEGWKDGTSGDLIQRFVKVARLYTGPPEDPGSQVYVMTDRPRSES